MMNKRKVFTISFILYPAICTLMAELSAEEWSTPILLTLLLTAIMAGVSLFPILLLIERLPNSQNFLWREAQALGILLTGMVAIGGIIAFVLQKEIGVVSWEYIFYFKPLGAYILCSLCYLIR